MRFFSLFILGLQEVYAHWFRSVLTMLGIILGVASVVAMSAIVEGLEKGMRDNIIIYGGLNKVLIHDSDPPDYQNHIADTSPGKTLNDVYALKRGATLLSHVSPEMGHRARITYQRRSCYPSEFIGAWPVVLQMNRHTLKYGRFFNELDERGAKPVCVIGAHIRNRLFGDPESTDQEINPVGKIIHINRQPFTVIGMFIEYMTDAEQKRRELERQNHKDRTGPRRNARYRFRRDGFYHKNNVVYIPINTMWMRFKVSSGTDDTPEPNLTDIDIKVAELTHMEKALDQARNILLHTHNGVEDFEFSTYASRIASAEERIKNANLIGLIISALSLFVGGIGVMNIMLASINERIREIGTFKALGANDFSIFIQIMMESSSLAILGGLLGLPTSFGTIWLLTQLIPQQNVPIITWEALFIGLTFSILTGIIAGLFPAYKASRLNPIEALRYE